MKFTAKINAIAIAASLMLVACGGGGGGGGGGNTGSDSTAAIGGVSTGTVVEGSTNAVSGKLTYANGAFSRPASLQGTYGAFTFNEVSGDWTYLVGNSKPATIALTAGQSVIDSMVVNTADNAATRTIAVTIDGRGDRAGIPLVLSVPAASYPSTDSFAADKLAVFNMLNDDRARCGFGKVAQASKLDQAAQSHSDYIARNKLGNDHLQISTLPGFTGVTPGNRIEAAGYGFSYAGEVMNQGDWGSIFGSGINTNNSPTTEFKSTYLLKRFYASIYHMAGAMSRNTEVGIGISNYKNTTGTYNTKIQVIDFATPSQLNQAGQQMAENDIATFPCQGTTGLIPRLTLETPDPFPSTDIEAQPYGQPVYLRSVIGNTLQIISGSIKLRNGGTVQTLIFDAKNDPNKIVTANEGFLVPTQRLADNSTYDVVINGTNNGVAFVKSFSFTTGTERSE